MRRVRAEGYWLTRSDTEQTLVHWPLSLRASLQGLSWPLITGVWDIYCTYGQSAPVDFCLEAPCLVSEPNHISGIAQVAPGLLPGKTSPILQV